ncbi:MAG: helix-turn-helix domain-containing protein [Veillonella sp.]|nr:helix-turn-helix domain-containing protein [Veillonella sp.]MCF0155544.1 helix-turn-helix domain-containing protein [Veillonella sp.]
MATLGDELKYERTRRGLTVRDVEQRLHIRASYLEALEEGHYDVIPGQVYLKGFLRNYGNFLGLDGARLVADYKRQNQAGDALSIVKVTADHGSVSIRELPTVESTRQQRPFLGAQNTGLAIGLTIILIIFIIWLIW